MTILSRPPYFQAKVHADLPGFESLQILGCLGRSAEAACAHLGERRLGLAVVHATKALQVTWIQGDQEGGSRGNHGNHHF